MSRFIRFTSHLSGNVGYVLRDEIGLIVRASEGGQEFTEINLIYFGGQGCQRVRETPDEIMALIEGETT